MNEKYNMRTSQKTNTQKYITMLIFVGCALFFVSALGRLYHVGNKLQKTYYASNRFTMVLEEILGTTTDYFRQNALVYNEQTKAYELSKQYMEEHHEEIEARIIEFAQRQKEQKAEEAGPTVSQQQETGEDENRNPAQAEGENQVISQEEIENARSAVLSEIIEEQLAEKEAFIFRLEAFANLNIQIEHDYRVVYLQGNKQPDIDEAYYYLEISNGGRIANETIKNSLGSISNSYAAEYEAQEDNWIRYDSIRTVQDYFQSSNSKGDRLVLSISVPPEELRAGDRIYAGHEQFKRDLLKMSAGAGLQLLISVCGMYYAWSLKRKRGYMDAADKEHPIQESKSEGMTDKLLWIIGRLKLEIKIILFVLGAKAFLNFGLESGDYGISTAIYQTLLIVLGILTLIDFANADKEEYCRNSFWVERREKKRKRHLQGIAKGAEALFDAIFVTGAAIILVFVYSMGLGDMWHLYFVCSLIGGAAILFMVWRLHKTLLDERMAYIDEIGEALSQIVSGNVSIEIEEKENHPFQSLAHNINRLRQGYGTAMEERMKSERMKTELITNVSHDLKTPLTSIVNYVDLLKKEDLQPEYAQDYVKILEQKTQRLNVLIQDLFEAAKAASGDVQLNMEQINITQLLKQTLAELDSKIQASGLDFVLRIPNEAIYVRADGKKLHRIFDNLIMNSLKYTLEGTRVYIQLEKNDKLLLSIKNIANYEMKFDEEEVIQRFVRGDEARSGEGSGLGLAIAKSLADRMNMELEITTDGDLFKAQIRMEYTV